MNDTSVSKNIKVNQVSSRTHFVRAGINLVDFFIGDSMKRIALTQGMFAIVDNEEFEWLSQYKWKVQKAYNTYYAVRGSYLGKGTKRIYKKIYMHRQILNAIPGQLTDHRNRNGLDNRRCNLRPCNNKENSRNRCGAKNSKSKYKGVSFMKNAKKWEAYIQGEHKNKEHLGLFILEVEAAKAYDIRAKEIYGEFALTNF